MIFIAANLIFFTLFYFVALIRDDYSIIDVAWGLSFILLAAMGLTIQTDAYQIREIILMSALILWGFRLSGYILYRNIKLGHEDARYAEMRKGWEPHVKLNAYLRVYVLQAALSLIVASPIWALFTTEKSMNFGSPLDYLAVALMLFGFLFESVADYQKNAFKSKEENQGKPCQEGLWKYSRHPNYFGEAVFWWGVGLLTVSVVPIYWAFMGPLFINFLLVKVSGVAMLEKSYEGKSAYDTYRSTTNSFFPWKPKNI